MLKEKTVVMVPTSDPHAPVCIYKGSNKPTTEIYSLAYHTNQHLYAVSNDKIKAGYWIYCWETNEIVLVKEVLEENHLYLDENGKRHYDNFDPWKWSPIIATTDRKLYVTEDLIADVKGQFSSKKSLPGLPQYTIQNFCDNGGGNYKIIVEYETIFSSTQLSVLDSTSEYPIDVDYTPQKLKVSADNTIIIK